MGEAILLLQPQALPECSRGRPQLKVSQSDFPETFSIGADIKAYFLQKLRLGGVKLRRCRKLIYSQREAETGMEIEGGRWILGFRYSQGPTVSPLFLC